MPLCITCTTPIPHLYTVYESAYNLRLEQCKNCLSFADPYVEHDSLTLILDLILMKRGVYRHLLYNRGSEPRTAYEKKVNQLVHWYHVLTINVPKNAPVQDETNSFDPKDEARWMQILRLGSGVLLVDAFIRWAQLHPQISADISQWTNETSAIFARILAGCFIETVAFHGGVMLASWIVLRLLDWCKTWRNLNKEAISGPGGSPYQFHGVHYENALVARALEMWDEDKLDREWVVRNVLGGMAAGFGIRGNASFSLILAGWVVKTAVAELMKDWVGAGGHDVDVWLAYSIP
ncbi:hypothetical protein ID866_1987 [Astraeus odoratus]|nr:hypothetical protein ID866_1987 [Astraeus odoratus]